MVMVGLASNATPHPLLEVEGRSAKLVVLSARFEPTYFALYYISYLLLTWYMGSGKVRG